MLLPGKPVASALMVFAFFGVLAVHAATGLLSPPPGERGSRAVTLIDTLISSIFTDPFGMPRGVLLLALTGLVLAVVAYRRARGEEGERVATDNGRFHPARIRHMALANRNVPANNVPAKPSEMLVKASCVPEKPVFGKSVRHEGKIAPRANATDRVWISAAMVDQRARQSITNPIIQSQDGRSMEYDKRNSSGEPMEKEYFPDEAWAASHADEREYRQLPNLFFGGGFWFVSAKAADVMRKFDLGSGALYPVKVFDKDHKTPLGNGWFCLNFGNVKSAFVPSESPNAFKSTSGAWYPLVPKDEDFAILSEASLPPDIWIDERVIRCFFLSARLGNALRKAKAAHGFMLYRCRMTG